MSRSTGANRVDRCQLRTKVTLDVTGMLAEPTASPMKWRAENPMRLWRIALVVVLVAVALCGTTLAAQFAMFPKAGQLVSPDGRLVVRNVERQGTASEFVGSFQALWLTDLASGRSRKLCDYLGLAAVAWSHNDFLIVTQYVGRRTSRALVFSVVEQQDPLILDKTTLTRLIPVELRPALRDNDHVFVEASRLEEDTLYLRVWGYGQHDANGFSWHCLYALRQGTVSCAAQSKPR